MNHKREIPRLMLSVILERMSDTATVLSVISFACSIFPRFIKDFFTDKDTCWKKLQDIRLSLSAKLSQNLFNTIEEFVSADITDGNREKKLYDLIDVYSDLQIDIMKNTFIYTKYSMRIFFSNTIMFISLIISIVLFLLSLLVVSINLIIAILAVILIISEIISALDNYFCTKKIDDLRTP